MFEADGRHAVAVGNTELPLVAAIDDPTVDVFVVEASSFRLLHSHRFAPDVGTWLNVAPDHLDPGGVGSHATMADYVAAKARIWSDQAPDQIAIGNADDPIVAAELARASIPPGHVRVGPWRRQPARGRSARARHRRHARGGAPSSTAPSRTTSRTRSPRPRPSSTPAARWRPPGRALLAFRGLPHRVTLVGEAGGVRWYDDSKATAPHATRAALQAFGSVVLIAGGRNKGLDLSRAGARGRSRPRGRRDRRVGGRGRRRLRRATPGPPGRRRWTTPSPRRHRSLETATSCCSRPRARRSTGTRPTASAAMTSCGPSARCWPRRRLDEPRAPSPPVER